MSRSRRQPSYSPDAYPYDDYPVPTQRGGYRGRQPSGRPRRRGRRGLLVLLLIPIIVAGAELVRRGVTGDPERVGSATPSVSPSPTVDPTPSLLASPTPSASPTPLYAAPVRIPTSGPGTWGYSATQGPVLGTGGTLRRFRIAIESGVESLGYSTDMESFSAFVDATLGDEKSWIAGRQVRFQRVPQGASYQFTIYLATGETARRLCAAAGVDIRIGGVPYTSCRGSGRVVINLNRWLGSVPEFVAKRIPLDDYRQYVVNHEVGHELGYGHERCPSAGQPAPVMQKQTLGLDGCTPNAWPYVAGRRYRGPPL